MKPSNFLLLDEPTNHLDLRAKEVLLRALLDFTGTIVFVSHDRYFIDKLATKVLAVGNGGVQVYLGNYEDYLWQAERSAEGARQQPAAVSDSLQAALDAAREGDNGAGSKKKARRMNPQQAQRFREQVAGLEEQISRLEAEARELERQLTQSFKDHQRAAELTAQMEERRQRIETCEQQWEELTKKLEAEA